MMNLQQKAFAVLLVAFLLSLGGAAFKKNQLEREIVRLRNAAAEKDKTAEIQNGLYEKLTLEVKNAKDLLDSKDKQLSELAQELRHAKEQLLTVNTLAVAWKKAYEATVAGKESKVPGTDGKSRTKVEFQKDFGYIGINGFTLTDPAEAFVHIQQNRPLKISIAVAQDKDRVWKTYASSSEDNVGVDIALTGVNPYFFDPKWYEKIGVTSSLGLGLGGKGSSVLLGVGATYQFGKYEVGPTIWLSDSFSTIYGATLIWHPFAK